MPLPGGRLAVVLADVSGKGMPAALVVARLSSEARYCLASETTPAEALNRLNTSFLRSGWEDRFVTMVLAVIDLEQHLLTVANAGHMPPLLRHGDKSLACRSAATRRACRWESTPSPTTDSERELAPGDCFTVFTDGISEAMDINNQLYGHERLRKQLLTGPPASRRSAAGCWKTCAALSARVRRATTCA